MEDRKKPIRIDLNEQLAKSRSYNLEPVSQPKGIVPEQPPKIVKKADD